IVERFDSSQHPSRVAAMVELFPTPPGWTETDLNKRPVTERAALACCINALQSAQLWQQRQERRIGLILGIGCEWLINWENDGSIANMRYRHNAVVESVRRALDIIGPAVTISAACASGNHALALARSWLRLGIVDACLAGGSDF